MPKKIIYTRQLTRMSASEIELSGTLHYEMGIGWKIDNESLEKWLDSFDRKEVSVTIKLINESPKD
jgi:hypothetical protein